MIPMTRVLMVRHRHRPNATTSAVSPPRHFRRNAVRRRPRGDIDMVLSIGGDGTFLVAASSARALNVPSSRYQRWPHGIFDGTG